MQLSLATCTLSVTSETSETTNTGCSPKLLDLYFKPQETTTAK